MNIIIVAEGAIDRHGKAITSSIVKDVSTECFQRERAKIWNPLELELPISNKTQKNMLQILLHATLCTRDFTLTAICVKQLKKQSTSLAGLDQK